MYRYPDPCAWGRNIGIAWWPAEASEPDPTDAEIADVMQRSPHVTSIVRYDTARDSVSLAAHLAIAVSVVAQVEIPMIPRHCAVQMDDVWDAYQELLEGNASGLPRIILNDALYRAWMRRGLESRCGLPRGSLARVPASTWERRELASWIDRTQSAHALRHAR